MADIPYIQQAQEVKITGQDTAGATINYVGADANGNLQVKDYATGTAGSSSPASAIQIGGTDGTNLRAIKTDSSGRQLVNMFDGSGNALASVNGQLNVITSFKPGTADLFGNLAISSHHNQIQMDFNYFSTGSAISAYGTLTTSGTGSNSLNTNGSASFSTGTSGTGFSKIQSPTTVIYQEGAEVYCSNSVCFTTPTSANSYQRSGIYDANNGYFIGYNGLSFGITKRLATVDTFTAQASFNKDTLTGASTSLFTRNGTPEALDPTKINLYRIRYGWYGVSPTYFDILSPDGEWVTFHKILYPNTNNFPSTQTPNLPVTVEVNTSGADATNLIMSAGALTAGVLDIKIPDTIVQPLNLGALNANITVTMAGQNSAGFQLNAGTLIGTIIPECSVDGGNTWATTQFYLPSTQGTASSIVFGSANTLTIAGIICFPGVSHARIRVSAYTSGTAVGLLRATAIANATPTTTVSAAFGTVVNAQFTSLSTATQLVAANPNRKYLSISNNGNHVLQIQFGSSTGLTATTGLPIPIANYYEFKGDNLYTGAVYGITSGTVSVSVTEGTP